MLKAIAAGKNGGELLILGLSDANIEKLREGRPIHFEGSQLGIKGLDFFIFWGKTEKDMHEMFRNRLGVRAEHEFIDMSAFRPEPPKKGGGP